VHVAVVGGGIAGLAAAHELAGHEGVTATVLEASPRLGGKVRTDPFAGGRLDAGPDAFLARRPEAVELCAELGLTDRLEPPATGSAWLWVGGRLRPLPTGTLLGVPTDLAAAARSGTLSPLGLARLAAAPLLARRTRPLGPGDATIGSVVRSRLGAEVHERLVDPLVGGINAGDTDALSIDAVAPQIAAAARRSADLVAGARALVPPRRPAAGEGGAGPPAPVFYGLPGGMEGLVEALTRRLAAAGTTLRTDAPVRSLTRNGSGWRVAGDGGAVEADAVVLATPAAATARLVAPHDPEAAAVLAAITSASVTLVAFAWLADAVPRPLDGSGFLVPRGEGRLMTACSWSSSKWAHLASPTRVLLRVSAGRADDRRADAMDDDELVARLRVELREALGIRAEPLDVRVTRWPDAFPQYAPGHLDRIAAAEARVAALGGLALAGAALRGVGIPACIGSGRAAARALVPVP
jgi:oxygen-dependent protoporphyrinogen oxidase